MDSHLSNSKKKVLNLACADQPADLRAGQHPDPAGGDRQGLAQDPQERPPVRGLRGVYHLVLQHHPQPGAHLPQRRHIIRYSLSSIIFKGL